MSEGYEQLENSVTGNGKLHYGELRRRGHDGEAEMHYRRVSLVYILWLLRGDGDWMEGWQRQASPVKGSQAEGAGKNSGTGPQSLQADPMMEEMPTVP